MTTIASEKDLVTKEDCVKSVKIMTDKIDKLDDKLSCFELKITKEFAEIPKKLADEFDKRYADKKTEQTVDRVVWLIVSSTLLSVAGLSVMITVLVRSIE